MKKKEAYIKPTTEALRVQCEGCLCQSQEPEFGMTLDDTMIIIDGYGNIIEF